MDKQKVIVICGPTASGKTKLSIEIAKKINGEIVSADSMQIYKEMDIGTAKPTIEEMQGIKHYLLDFVSPDKRYSVAEYKKDAINAIDEIVEKNKVPIVVGGTGLYINSLIYGIEYPEIEIDIKYRNELEKTADEPDGLRKLYEMAEKIDEEAIKNISPNDKKRICRVLEIYHSTGKTKTQQEIESRKNGPKYDYLIYGLNMDRDKLYDRINKRVDIMFENGLVKEVEDLFTNPETWEYTSFQGIGYKEFKDYFLKEKSIDEVKTAIKTHSRQYAKRQYTWFKNQMPVHWFEAQNRDEIYSAVKEWLMDEDK